MGGGEGIVRPVLGNRTILFVRSNFGDSCCPTDRKRFLVINTYTYRIEEKTDAISIYGETPEIYRLHDRYFSVG